MISTRGSRPRSSWLHIASATARKIIVANCPGKNAVAVAELAFGLMLALDRRIKDGAVDLANGRWNKKEYGKAKGLFGRTLGILGTGTIGREVIQRARAFGMPVVAWSRSLTPESAASLGVVAMASPTEVAAKSDVLSVHLALKPETRGLIGDGVFASMRPGTIFALAESESKPCGIGLAVIERDWAGIFAMHTAARFRGQGVARAVLGALMTRATAMGARRLYIQVEQTNGPAQHIYRRAGFGFAYSYHYRTSTAALPE